MPCDVVPRFSVWALHSIVMTCQMYMDSLEKYLYFPTVLLTVLHYGISILWYPLVMCIMMEKVVIILV